MHNDVIWENKPRGELISIGKSLWTSVPRESHAGWEAPEDRLDPSSIILSLNQNDVIDQVPARYSRMLQSSFAFFCGSAGVMAADLSKTLNTGILVQSCGDCHLMNFGCYVSADGKMIFDIVDFDETLPAPWEWDVKRLATSFIIASRHNKISDKEAKDIAAECVRSYREHMQNYASMDFLEMWYSMISADDILEGSGFEDAIKKFSRRIKKAAKKTIIEDDFPKLGEIKDGKGSIKDNPPQIFHHKGIDNEKYYGLIEEIFKSYRQLLSPDKQVLLEHYEFHDLAVKVSAIGGIETHSGIILCMSPDKEPLFLQVKEARNSVLEPYLAESIYKNRGERVVAGQKLMQADDDIFLGWAETAAGRQYYIRQSHNIKIKPQVEILDGDTMRGFAGLCGWALAKAHARSGKAALISGYLGDNSKFEVAISQFAFEYALQNEKDFETFQLPKPDK
jgi:uncharacterized protein (DUF2252 family)